MIAGHYYDPRHGRCLRRVTCTSPTTYTIYGVYGRDEVPHTHRLWTATMTAVRTDPRGNTHLTVDFSGKPIKCERHMTAVYRRRELVWSDGNVWHQLYVHPRQLQP